MKTISCILAIAAIMATTDAMFPDVDYTYLSMLRASYIDPDDGRSFSTTINSDVKVRFFAREQRGQNDVSFKAEDPPQIPADPPRNHPNCGSVLGVYIQRADSFFCRINLFKIEVVNEASNDPQLIRLILYFQEEGMLPLALGIPIQKLPAAIMVSPHEPELEEWGSYYGVGTNPPFDFEELLRTDATKSMTIDFEWLESLLAFGVYWKRVPTTLRVEGSPPTLITTYITRPLLISEELMVRTKLFIDSLNDPREESVGSNALLWGDDSEEEVSSNP